jgi:TRAP-type C4-dicarboxylate transport system substrate-binding protein
MMEVAQEIGKKYQENGRKTDAQAIEMMKKYGMKVKTPTDEELKIWEDFKEEIIPDVIDAYVPKEVYDKVISAIDE